jgi:hypothetical protein
MSMASANDMPANLTLWPMHSSVNTPDPARNRLAQLPERVGQVEQRIARLRTQRETVQQERLDEAEATRALAGLDPAWTTLTPQAQARVVQLLVSQVDYDGTQGKVAITFHPLSLKTLAGDRLGHNSEEQSA